MKTRMSDHGGVADVVQPCSCNKKIAFIARHDSRKRTRTRRNSLNMAPPATQRGYKSFSNRWRIMKSGHGVPRYRGQQDERAPRGEEDGRACSSRHPCYATRWRV